jgi:hypothetical protein
MLRFTQGWTIPNDIGIGVETVTDLLVHLKAQPIPAFLLYNDDGGMLVYGDRFDVPSLIDEATPHQVCYDTKYAPLVSKCRIHVNR